ncbi:elongin A, like isoform X2 [Centropristis striata]|uniref:elongin A, like isoform X2 n=1 Tax=Centropristis striata TaxID=184440 RepID=UPI0027E01D2E|nr:elongin A, like isoform X2 [Centropristis striata]
MQLYPFIVHSKRSSRSGCEVPIHSFCPECTISNCDPKPGLPYLVVKILQKLKDLDITLDVLSETGIGKTVNSLRRHEQAGELAKSLVRDWKRLVPKESTSHTEDGNMSESVSVKDKSDNQNCPNNVSLTMVDLNNNCLTSHSKSQNSSDEALFKSGSRKADSEKQCEEQKLNKNENDKSQQEDPNISQNDIFKKKIKEDQSDYSVVPKKKKSSESNRNPGDTQTLPGDRNTEDTHRKSSSDSKEKLKSSSDSGKFWSEKESNKKPKEGKETFSFEFSDKNSSKWAGVKDDKSSEIQRSSKAQNKKRKKKNKEKHGNLKYKQESEEKGHSKNKKAKINHRETQSESEEPSLSFESCLNYEVNVVKRKDKSGVKKPTKTMKNVEKEEQRKDPGMKPFRSSVTQFKESVMDLIPFSIPLPADLPELEKPFSVDYFERKVEKESDFCDVSEESSVFTGQRLNKKMQVYSGAKSVFLPTMMSLHQQCIRTLQNNINLLFETGGVPFEILEPVLERCTPEQLLRIEECNPIYIGETDHLWGKHCQRDFKDSKLQEYESWKEMYIRLSDERERKLKRLTKSIVSAHSSKPRGRQVKMAFIHTVAKPPRDVRIQQEIHGTAVQQPQLRCSVKVQDNRPRPSSNEPSRSSSTSSVSNNTQDPRKKTRVAPMMAKSLKAFKKQLGRR